MSEWAGEGVGEWSGGVSEWSGWVGEWVSGVGGWMSGVTALWVTECMLKGALSKTLGGSRF